MTNNRGRVYGTVLRTKHFDTLSSMLRQLEDERVRRRWTMDRFDMEAGYATGYYQSIVNDNRSIRIVTLMQYARAVNKTWRLV